jgi:hypothetical protein
MREFRVMFQYLGPAGPHFEFTTVLAVDEQDAAEQLASARRRDLGLSIAQVVEANDFVTGYDKADADAAAEEIAARGRVD